MNETVVICIGGDYSKIPGSFSHGESSRRHGSLGVFDLNLPTTYVGA